MSQQIERFGKSAILSLNVEGFENLTLEKKHLVYHLSQSGLYGRDLYLQQNYEHNLSVKNVLESLYSSIQEQDTTNLNLKVFNNFTLYLKEFWLNVGIYNCFSNKILDIPFDDKEFDYLIDFSDFEFNQDELSIVKNVLFNESFRKKFKNIQEEGVDFVEESGGNFYSNLKNHEVILFRDVNYPKMENSPQFGFNVRLVKKTNNTSILKDDPLYKNSIHSLTSQTIQKMKAKYNQYIELIKEGLNEIIDENTTEEKTEEQNKKILFAKNILSELEEQMIKQFTESIVQEPKMKKQLELMQEKGIDIDTDYFSMLDNMLKKGESKNFDYIIEEVICENGLYGNHVKGILEHLTLALPYAENHEQQHSIQTLINFYKTGRPEDFDIHSLAWVKDQESEIFFINGLIESYDDPKGVGCTFESIVAFKNPEQTEKVNNIIKNIQWFEDNMPVDKEFKKDKAAGLSASSVTVSGMAGATSPTLPLGICLPNSDWIRAEHGSKSVNLANVHNARGESEADLKNEFFFEQYLPILKTYSSMSGSLHTDLHEVAGHGSCKNREGVSNDALDIYYSVIEEARADLVGLYFINRPELIDFGILDANVNLKDFGDSQYVSYITNGALLQLRRVELGSNLAQPHLRNRQLIANWILEKSQESKCVELVTKSGKTYAVLNDFDKLRELFGELLGEIQRIKSTGDFKSAKNIVETYGTIVNYDRHEQVLNRVEKLNPPTLYGFTTPIYTPVLNDNGDIIDYDVHQKATFAEDQLFLSKKYS
jgi:hypothetical protein